MASTTWWDTRWIEYPLGWRTWWPAASMSRGRLMQGPSVDRPLLQVLWWCSPRWTEVLLPAWSMFLLPLWCLLLLWVVCLWWRLLIFLFVVAVVERWGWWVRCMLWTCISILRSCWSHHRKWVVWFCIGGCSSPDPLVCWLQMLPLLMLDTVTVLTCCLCCDVRSSPLVPWIFSRGSLLRYHVTLTWCVSDVVCSWWPDDVFTDCKAQGP